MRLRVENNKIWFVVGRSADENWQIVSEADKDYYWVHAENSPSSHVIVEIDDPLDADIEYACNLCRAQTKKLKNSSVQFIATQVKNLKFGSKPGEVYFKHQSSVRHFMF